MARALPALLVTLALGLVIVPVLLAQPQVKTVPASRIESMGGSDLYRDFCAVCHGVDLKGRGPASAVLKIPPTDLTTLARQNGGKFPDLRVLRSIDGQDRSLMTLAHGTPDMPIWGQVFGKLIAEEGRKLAYSNLIGYIESAQVK